jgi:hypothetical protein
LSSLRNKMILTTDHERPATDIFKSELRFETEAANRTN